MKKATMKKTTKKLIWITAFSVFAVMAVLAVTQILSYYVTSHDSEAQNSDLAGLISWSEPVESTSSTEETASQSGSGGGGAVPNYDELYRRNKDMIGWIMIGNTKINYPVMQTPSQYDYYLDHDFYGGNSAYGVPFVGDGMDALKPSDNVVIYGHHMIDGSMFSAVDLYKSKDFYNAHRYIEFNTKNGRATYQIFACVVTVVYTASDAFPYWKYSDFSDKQEYEEFIGLINKYKRYDTGITPQYGDKFLMLSTCEYSNTNGRTVVIARRIQYTPNVSEEPVSSALSSEESKPLDADLPKETEETTASKE